jgi:hypothetical protein
MSGNSYVPHIQISDGTPLKALALSRNFMQTIRCTEDILTTGLGIRLTLEQRSTTSMPRNDAAVVGKREVPLDMERSGTPHPCYYTSSLDAQGAYPIAVEHLLSKASRLNTYVSTYFGPSPPCGVCQLISWSGTLMSHVLQWTQLLHVSFTSIAKFRASLTFGR